MTHQDLFHEGERAVQVRAGEVHTALLNARMISPSIMQGAIPFIARQPWVILGGEDAAHRLWCSALIGEGGFAQAEPDGSGVTLDLDRAPAHPANPLLATHLEGRPTGALFIEPATRRRLRVNGRIATAGLRRLRLTVEESFPNCSRFIQKRSFDGIQSTAVPLSAPRSGTSLGPDELALIAAADTLFLATRHPDRGVDVSHRGGRPGFAQWLDDRTLRLPDYPGNGLFQSFGNLAVDSRMGILVPDFDSGALLHLTGFGQVLWDVPGTEAETGGTSRFLVFQVAGWVLTPPAEGAPRWSFVEASPTNP
ncbi:pyridoxamine 5'-phosphate oxidase family protein [Geothrix terrae]|uniref:pyridoxamine 5'-phosphate oxidase family protein n=1 Tax=Geothrix terrae TaxID=2922720 RepID=UPI001FAB9C8C|nr:pyridoxamine 5'-phosphate oxidase family protein [Geothrix terrae]